MSNLTKQIFTASVIVAAVASLTACNTAQQDRTTGERPVEEQVVTEYEDIDTMERPAAMGIEGLRSLRAGQPVSYYTNQFQSMGYNIEDIRRDQNSEVYELSRDNERVMVTLVTNGSERVNMVMSEEMRPAVQTGAQPDQTTQRITREIQDMPVGKKPIEYIQSVDRLGTVSQYKLHRDHAVIQLEADKKRYDVRMEVDPTRQVVTKIEVDRNIWQLPS